MWILVEWWAVEPEWLVNLVVGSKPEQWALLPDTTKYRKTSSRGAYGHDPFWSVFKEYPLDSKRSNSTMILSIIYIVLL